MKEIYLKPVFSSNDIGKDLIFINCVLGYNGNINILFAEKTYDYLKERKIKNFYPKGKKPEWPEYRIVKNFKIFPETPQNYKLFILEENKTLDLHDKNINYTYGLQVDSDKFCLACNATTDSFRNSISENCEILDCNGNLLRKLNIGTGVIDIQTNGNHELWVSYNDIGVFQGDLGKTGLNCFNVNGKILYGYDAFPGIVDCKALNVYSDNEVVFSNYCGTVKLWHAFVRINDKKVVKAVEWRGANFIALSENFALIENIYNSFDINSRFALIDLDKYTVNLDTRENYDMQTDTFVDPYSNKEELDNVTYEFLNENNEKLNCVHAQKDTLYFWHNNSLYTYNMNKLM